MFRLLYYDNINFYVTAYDPTGPWSDPVIIKGAEGIDPTLVFDGDEVYYLGNKRPNPDIPECESPSFCTIRTAMRSACSRVA